MESVSHLRYILILERGVRGDSGRALLWAVRITFSDPSSEVTRQTFMVFIASFANTGKMPSGQVVSLSYAVDTHQREVPSDEGCLDKHSEAVRRVGRPIRIAGRTILNAFGRRQNALRGRERTTVLLLRG